MGDVATWAGVTTSVIISGAALVVSIVSVRHARRAADAAERQAVAAEKALPPPPPDVAWRIEHVNNAKYVVRNVGTKPAFGVKIHTDEVGRASVRVLDQNDRPIPPEGSLPLMISGSLGVPAPDELLVSWDGNPNGTLLAVPPRPRS